MMREVAFPFENCFQNQDYISLFVFGQNECGNYKSWIYFIGFIIMCKILLMNMIIGIFTVYFVNNKLKNKIMNKQHSYEFCLAWSEFDKNLTFKLSCEEFLLLCIDLDEPFNKIFEISNWKSSPDEITGNFLVTKSKTKYISRVNFILLSYIFDNINLTEDNKVHYGDALIYLIFKIINGNTTENFQDK